MGRIGRVRGEGLGLERPPLMAAQPRAQDMSVHAVALFSQFDLEAAGAVPASMVVEHGEHFRFPGQLGCPTAPAAEACRQA